MSDDDFHSRLPSSAADLIDFAKELNAEQHAAVTAPDGPALVLAGAGSGKTRTLTYRVAYLLSKRVPAGEIMLVTFTNKAAREMLHRVEELTGVPGRRFWGGTFHSLGQRAIRMFGESIGIKPDFTILDEDDTEKLFTEAIRDTRPAYLKDKDRPKPRSLLDMMSYARNTLRGLADTVRKRYPWNEEYLEEILTFEKLYEQRKRAANVADYDDLLDLWLTMLRTQPEVADYFPRRFKHLLVDEYQDTNRLQMELVDRLGRHHGIMAVGDDAQCIYTWRGADVDNILAFPDRHPGTTIYKIETNYRSTPEILRLANGVLTQGPAMRAFTKELRPVRPSRSKPIVAPVMDPRSQADYVIRRILSLADRGLALNDIAVLYRAHFQALEIQLELTRRGIPFVITSGLKFFDQAHVKDLVAHLRIVHNPADSTAWARIAGLLPRVGDRTAGKLYAAAKEIIAERKIGFGAALLDPKVMGKVPAEAREDFEELAHTLAELEGAPQDHPAKLPEGRVPSVAQPDLFGENPTTTTPAASATEPVSTRPAKPVAPPRAGDVRPERMVEIAINGWYGDYLRQIYPSNWQERRDDLTSLIGFATRFDTLPDLLSQLVLLNADTTERRLEPPRDGVRLTTVHQAKGLEYPVVFLIGCADGLFPLKRAMEDGDIEEERRLFYVGVTRARDELHILYPLIGGGGRGGPPQNYQPSVFLRELPTDRYELDRAAMRARW